MIGILCSFEKRLGKLEETILPVYQVNSGRKGTRSVKFINSFIYWIKNDMPVTLKWMINHLFQIYDNLGDRKPAAETGEYRQNSGGVGPCHQLL